MNLDRLTEILKQEFLCYYHADLIPTNWKDIDVQSELAKASSARLLGKVDRKGDLIELLQLLCSNRSHPINMLLSEETDIEWCIEDDDWYGYKALLNEIINVLNK